MRETEIKEKPPKPRFDLCVHQDFSSFHQQAKMIPRSICRFLYKAVLVFADDFRNRWEKHRGVTLFHPMRFTPESKSQHLIFS